LADTDPAALDVAARETELAERWPEHVVCSWIGHSSAVARKHYLQVTEAHFRAASALHPALQQARPQGHTELQAKGQDAPEPAYSQPVEPTAACCTNQDVSMVGATGLEPTAKSPGKQENPNRAAQNPAHSEQKTDVAELARRLAALPEADRRALAAALATR